MKKVFIGLGVLVVIAGILLWRVYANLDMIVQKIIEDVGTEVTQTSVSVGGVQLELLDGKAGISGLTVANPPGFTSPNIFTLDGIAVAIDVQSLNSNPIIINEVVISQPKVNYEVNKDRVSNLDVLNKNVSDYSAGSDASGGDQQPSDGDSGAPGEEIKLIIRKLSFEGGHLSAVSAAAPDKKIEADLPPFNMTNIGASTNGATSSRIGKEITDRLVKEATNAATRAGVDKLTEELKGKALESLDEKVGGALKGLLK